MTTSSHRTAGNVRDARSRSMSRWGDQEHAVDLSPAGALVDGVLAFCQAVPDPVVNQWVGNLQAGTTVPPAGPLQTVGPPRPHHPGASVPRPKVPPPKVPPPEVPPRRVRRPRVVIPRGARRLVSLPSPGVPQPTVAPPGVRPLPNQAPGMEPAAEASIRHPLPAGRRRPTPAPHAQALIPSPRALVFPGVFAGVGRRPSAPPDAISARGQLLTLLPSPDHSAPQAPRTGFPREFGRGGTHAAGRSDPPCRPAAP